MADRRDAELDRLRRAAFARGGTEHDLAALADALGAADAPTPNAESGERTGERPLKPVTEPSAVPTVAAAGSRRAWTVRTAILGVVALLAGGAGGWTLHAGTAGQPQSPALAAFPALPVAENPWPDSLSHADSRLLGEIDGVRFIGTTGSSPGSFPGPSGPLVCLHVQDGDLAAGTCAPRDAFLATGIWVGLSDPDGTRTYYWGPDGPPGIVVCAPSQWLVSCPPGITNPTVPTLAP